MSIYDDGYGALWDISDGIKYLNVYQKSEFHRRVANGLLPPTVKTGGDRRQCIGGELREIRAAYARGAEDAEIIELVRQLVAIRPLLPGRSDDEILALVRELAAVHYQPQDDVTPMVGDTLEDAAHLRRPLVQRRATTRRQWGWWAGL
jgi:hypothetical protein